MVPNLLGDRYEVGRLLGTGAISEVYEGWDRPHGRRVAIKVLLDEHAEDTRTVARFRDEARVAAGLRHPSIVRVEDAQRDGGVNFVVLEMVEGPSLAERCAGRAPPEGEGAPVGHAPLHWQEVARIGVAVCAALDHAHRQEVAHGRLTPRDVLLGAGGAVKVGGFGVSSHAASAASDRASYVDARYRAPERTRGSRPDPRSDLYALACCLYEAATGEVPFDGDSAAVVAVRHISEDPVPPQQRNPVLPAALGQILLRALAKRPTDRQQTAAALGDELERLLAAVEPATAAAVPPAVPREVPREVPPAVPPAGAPKLGGPRDLFADDEPGDDEPGDDEPGDDEPGNTILLGWTEDAREPPPSSRRRRWLAPLALVLATFAVASAIGATLARNSVPPTPKAPQAEQGMSIPDPDPGMAISPEVTTGPTLGGLSSSTTRATARAETTVTTTTKAPAETPAPVPKPTTTRPRVTTTTKAPPEPTTTTRASTTTTVDKTTTTTRSIMSLPFESPGLLAAAR